ncbi:dTDP-4-dehydrorhamnose reductase [Thermogladius sp. 4427co]|uniref:dTDP-4-dehydrorhamnose reductase n=1 Tax=Thermogladius sp. 4427co TaxID=3450718 RepID=UPI003F7B0698
MRILVTGGTGLLGYNALKILREKGFKTYATFHTHNPPPVDGVEWIRLDLGEYDKVLAVLKELKPDIVLHTAAYTDVDGCEVNRDVAYRVNYLATRALASAVLEAGGFLVYISTDYIFDGERGMYKEEDIPYPINFYGFTKLLGEVAVQSILGVERALIIRISGLYGYSPTGKKNFGLQALEKLVRGEGVYAFYDQYLSPTYAYHLAQRIVEALDKGVHGVIHLAGERMSRYEYATMLAEAVGADKSLVIPISIREARLAAKRPRDSSLNTLKAREIGLSLPSVRESIEHFVRSYREVSGV